MSLKYGIPASPFVTTLRPVPEDVERIQLGAASYPHSAPIIISSVEWNCQLTARCSYTISYLEASEHQERWTHGGERCCGSRARRAGRGDKPGATGQGRHGARAGAEDRRFG